MAPADLRRRITNGVATITVDAAIANTAVSRGNSASSAAKHAMIIGSSGTRVFHASNRARQPCCTR